MNPAASNVEERLRNGIIPALPVVMSNGAFSEDGHIRYAEYMRKEEPTGLAVWAHTGRGLLLEPDVRDRVLTFWRTQFPNVPLIAGAGARDVNGKFGDSSDAAYLKSAEDMARRAAELGADALLCYAPSRYRDLMGTERRDRVLEYHHALSRAGVPLILFYLYEAAGGIQYDSETLTTLLKMPEVTGIKVATLDSVMTFQDISQLIQTSFGAKLLITGEDRFLGYSILRGASAALVGMGAAFANPQQQLFTLREEGRMRRFVAISTMMDLLAEATFIHPMEGYIGRMLLVLHYLGVLRAEEAIDPYGPSISNAEAERIRTVTTELKTFVETIPDTDQDAA